MSPALRQIPLFLGTLLLLCPLSGCGLINYAAAPKETSSPLFETNPVRYRVDIRVEEENLISDLRSSMERHSQLIQLQSQPPDGMLGLERRARIDEQTAVRLLHSMGYYDGTASASVREPETEGGEALVTLTLLPGPRYHMGETNLSYQPAPGPLPSFPDLRPEPLAVPEKLSGLGPDKPAEADNVLAAVEDIPETMRCGGYPEAAVSSTRYTLNKTRKTLNADVVIDPGPAAVMGGA